MSKSTDDVSPTTTVPVDGPGYGQAQHHQQQQQQQQQQQGGPSNTSLSMCPTSPHDGPGETPEQHEAMMELLRGRAFIGAVGQLVLGISGIPFCWIGYGFTALLVSMLIIFGAIAVAHLNSLQSLRTSNCCCGPLNAVRQLHTCFVVTGIFAVLALACNVINAVMAGNATVRVFAVIAIVHSLLSSVFLVYSARNICALRDRCSLDDEMTRGPMAPAGPCPNVNMSCPRPCYPPAHYGPQGPHYGGGYQHSAYYTQANTQANTQWYATVEGPYTAQGPPPHQQQHYAQHQYPQQYGCHYTGPPRATAAATPNACPSTPHGPQHHHGHGGHPAHHGHHRGQHRAQFNQSHNFEGSPVYGAPVAGVAPQPQVVYMAQPHYDSDHQPSPQHGPQGTGSAPSFTGTPVATPTQSPQQADPRGPTPKAAA